MKKKHVVSSKGAAAAWLLVSLPLIFLKITIMAMIATGQVNEIQGGIAVPQPGIADIQSGDGWNFEPEYEVNFPDDGAPRSYPGGQSWVDDALGIVNTGLDVYRTFSGRGRGQISEEQLARIRAEAEAERAQRRQTIILILFSVALVGGLVYWAKTK